MKSLSDSNQTDIIEAFNSTSRYLDDLLNIDNPFFDRFVSQIYPSELDRGPISGFTFCLFLMALFHPKSMTNVMILILIL